MDARNSWEKMHESLGEKRKRISDEQIAEIVRLYGTFEESERVKILPNEAFDAMRITVDRPLRLRWEVSEETLAAVASDGRLLDAREERARELETDRDALLVSYAEMVPEALEGLSGEERSRVYRMLQLEVRTDPEGYEVNGALCNSRPTGCRRPCCR